MSDDGLSIIDGLATSTPMEADDFHQWPGNATPAIPGYLEDTYWWAYLRSGSIWVFEREWLVNLILMGNMHRLTNAVLDEIGNEAPGEVLQLACVYGDFSNRLATHLKNSRSQLHVLDIASIQLRNARRKLRHHISMRLHHQDSSALQFSANRFDHTVVFFLLHEQPEEVRRKTISEAIRVTRPGGKVIFVDYHGPRWSNPLRYLIWPVLNWLEPFALDLWQTELEDYLPDGIERERISTKFYCGGLYQRVVIDC